MADHDTGALLDYARKMGRRQEMLDEILYYMRRLPRRDALGAMLQAARLELDDIAPDDGQRPRLAMIIADIEREMEREGE